jgi:hypothetical protein
MTTFFAPFQNPSIYRLMSWFYGSSNTKSIKELNFLVKGVILAPDFKPEHFIGFSTTKEQALMDAYQEPSSGNENPSPFESMTAGSKGRSRSHSHAMDSLSSLKMKHRNLLLKFTIGSLSRSSSPRYLSRVLRSFTPFPSRRSGHLHPTKQKNRFTPKFLLETTGTRNSTSSIPHIFEDPKAISRRVLSLS